MIDQSLQAELDLVIAAAKAVKMAKADGKIDIQDVGALLLIAPKLGPAIDAIPKLKEHLKDLQAPECAESVAYLISGLALEDAKAKLVIEKSLAVLVAAFDLYQVLK